MDEVAPQHNGGAFSPSLSAVAMSRTMDERFLSRAPFIELITRHADWARVAYRVESVRRAGWGLVGLDLGRLELEGQVKAWRFLLWPASWREREYRVIPSSGDELS